MNMCDPHAACVLCCLFVVVTLWVAGLAQIGLWGDGRSFDMGLAVIFMIFTSTCLLIGISILLVRFYARHDKVEVHPHILPLPPPPPPPLLQPALDPLPPPLPHSVVLVIQPEKEFPSHLGLGNENTLETVLGYDEKAPPTPRADDLKE